MSGWVVCTYRDIRSGGVPEPYVTELHVTNDGLRFQSCRHGAVDLGDLRETFTIICLLCACVITQRILLYYGKLGIACLVIRFTDIIYCKLIIENIPCQ